MCFKRRLLNDGRISTALMDCGSRFHRVGPTVKKALSPKLMRVAGTRSKSSYHNQGRVITLHNHHSPKLGWPRAVHHSPKHWILWPYPGLSFVRRVVTLQHHHSPKLGWQRAVHHSPKHWILWPYSGLSFWGEWSLSSTITHLNLVDRELFITHLLSTVYCSPDMFISKGLQYHVSSF
jgi:hypothetical protein